MPRRTSGELGGFSRSIWTCSTSSAYSASKASTWSARLHRRRPERRLREIEELISGIDDANGMADRMGALSERKLSEIEALLERTKAMKGWLEVARKCGCATPEECALFPASGEGPVGPDLALRVIWVAGKNCTRPGTG